MNKQGENVFSDHFEKDDYFDDCPICQAQKKASDEGRKPTFEELRKAFKEASKIPGTYSGTGKDLILKPLQ